MELLRTEILANGLVVEFLDESNRYFGDYWRVKLEVRCRISVEAVFSSGEAQKEQALALLGKEAVFTRTLEKMGVSSAELENTRKGMVDHFLANAGAYLGSPEFPGRFVRQQLAEKKKGRRPFLVSK